MKQIRKKTLDKATESVITRAALAGTPLVFDRYEDMSPVCRFGQVGLDCKACTQGPCRINPFDPSNGTICGRQREDIVAASFLSMVSAGAAANAAFSGAQAQVAATIFEGMLLANEGNGSSSQMLEKALEVATAGFDALGQAKAGSPAPAKREVGLGALVADKINVLMIGSIPAAQAQGIAAELKSNPKVNLVGAVGGEIAGLPAAANYNGQEALLVTTGVDAVIAGKVCVSPAFLSLAAKQGVPVASAEGFDAATLLAAADVHFRTNQGRNIAEKLPSTPAVMGFGAGSFAGISDEVWQRLASMGIKGVALLGGCNNVVTTQDAVAGRQTEEFLSKGVLVVASGCASVGLAKAGYMNPVRRSALAGSKLEPFLAALSEAAGVEIPAVLDAGSCWELPVALELAQLLQKKLGVPMVAAMPELSRPASWSAALAVAGRGIPTYVGPILPLDGGMATVSTLNELLRSKGGALVGPGQVSSPEAVVNLVLDA